MHKFLFVLLFSYILLNYSNAQGVTGDWHGLLEGATMSVRLTIHVDSTEDGFSAYMDSPDQGFYELKAETVTISGDVFKINFSFGVYNGLVSRKLQIVEGVWNGGAGLRTLNLGRQTIEPPESSLIHIKNQYEREEKYIEMRDGVRLFTSIYCPRDTTESYPILITRTPYNSEPDEESYNWRLFYIMHLLKERYIFVFQDVRGRYMSEGEFVNVRPYEPNKKKKKTDENSDAFDTIEWLINNVDNNNGNVGVFGVSYPGFYASMSLPDAHPALKAVSPQAPVTDWFMGDDLHHNGAFFLMDAFQFLSNFFRTRSEPSRSEPGPFEFNNNDNYDFFMDLGPVNNVKPKYFGDSVQFWSDLMAHPDYDSFWKERNPLPHLTDIKPAVLVVGGWFDAEDLYGSLKTYQAIESQNEGYNQNRLVMGPWSHGQWYTVYGESIGNIHFGSNTSTTFKDLELQFFNYYLKGKGEMNLPEASIFITGANEWRSFDNWPPREIEKSKLYLDCEDGLSFIEPEEEECYDEYISDPGKPVPYSQNIHWHRTQEYMLDDQRFANRRPDVMVYETEILEEDITVVGPLMVKLFVSTTGTDADYIVKIIDVFPDQLPDYPQNDDNMPMGAYQMLVRGEVMRGKYRESFEDPQAFVPGEITEISFDMPDIAHQFKKGHRIMVQIQNSWFPLVDINPQTFVNIYEAERKDFIKATHRIYHDSQRPSSISISILKD